MGIDLAKVATDLFTAISKIYAIVVKSCREFTCREFSCRETCS
jgi:hypothetical protein